MSQEFGAQAAQMDRIALPAPPNNLGRFDLFEPNPKLRLYPFAMTELLASNERTSLAFEVFH